jgi:hypothetical protein
MRGLLALIAACFIAACGARSELAAPVDAGCGAPAPAAAGACAPLAFMQATAASCALSNPDCVPVDLEGLQADSCMGGGGLPCDAGSDRWEVFALTRYGRGHLAAWCDGTSLTRLLSSIPLEAYLGQSASPRVATLGGFPCGVGMDAPPGTYLGTALPAQYLGHPEQLAADWDALVLCAWPEDGADHTGYPNVPIEWAPTLRAYVHDHAKGLLVSSDYANPPASPPDLFDALNAITRPAGVVFDIADIGWSDTTVDAACVPDWPK